jgi:hypothetical protein
VRVDFGSTGYFHFGFRFFRFTLSVNGESSDFGSTQNFSRPVVFSRLRFFGAGLFAVRQDVPEETKASQSAPVAISWGTIK